MILSLGLQNMFNMTAANAIGARYNLSSVPLGRKDDIASLLEAPGLDADELWRETAHSSKKIIKEVGRESLKSNVLHQCE